MSKEIKSGVELISDEQKRMKDYLASLKAEQRNGFENGSLAKMAAVYALPDEHYGFGSKIRYELRVSISRFYFWPHHICWFKKGKSRLRELVKAGALIAAEIDRLQNTHPSND